MEHARQISLDALEQQYASTSNIPMEDRQHAASVTLPESHEGSSLEEISTIQSPVSDATDYSNDERQDWWERVMRLTQFMPHLKNVRKTSSIHGRAEVTCFDYAGDELASVDDYCFEGDYETARFSFRQRIIDSVPSSIHLRYVVVEDLSPILIDLLGSCLGVSPEFFEEHLVNSGWVTGTYDDPEPNTWNTRDLIKDYTAVRWDRPVKRVLTRPTSFIDHRYLQNRSLPSLRWLDVGGSPNPRILLHSYKSLVNILRREWDFDPGFDDIVAWKEGATVWRTQLGSCHVVLLLLDPLPIVREWIAVKDPGGQPDHQQNQGPSVPRRRQSNLNSSHESRRGARDSRIEAGSPSPNTRLQLPHGSTHSGLPEETVPPTLTDGLNDRDIEAENPVRRNNNSITSRSKAGLHSMWRRITNWRHVPHVRPANQQSRDSVINQPSTGQPQPNLDTVSDACIFEAQAPRMPFADYNQLISDTNPSDLSTLMHPTMSTKESLKRCLTLKGCQSKGKFTPLDALLDIMIHDTLNLLQSMDSILINISSKILDETIVQMKVDDWRRVHRSFDMELRRMAQSLQTFDKYLSSTKDLIDVPSGPERPPTYDKRLFQDCVQMIFLIRKRTEVSNKSLMTTMSLVESKKGIAEAESVTKLTELAFFFIPLTFSASVFSMQVRELDSGEVTLVAFFALAIVITTCSYALRLIIRSSSAIRFWKDCKDSIRSSADLPANAPIRTTSVVLWLWNVVWHRVGLPLFTSVFVAMLLAILWTRPLEQGIQAGATTALGIMGLSLVLMTLLMTKKFKVSAKWARRIARGPG